MLEQVNPPAISSSSVSSHLRYPSSAKLTNPLAAICLVMGIPHLYGLVRSNLWQLRQLHMILGHCARAVTVMVLTAAIVEVLTQGS